jgi:hypothetical protein
MSSSSSASAATGAAAEAAAALEHVVSTEVLFEALVKARGSRAGFVRIYCGLTGRKENTVRTWFVNGVPAGTPGLRESVVTEAFSGYPAVLAYVDKDATKKRKDVDERVRAAERATAGAKRATAAAKREAQRARREVAVADANASRLAQFEDSINRSEARRASAGERKKAEKMADLLADAEDVIATMREEKAALEARLKDALDRKVRVSNDDAERDKANLQALLEAQERETTRARRNVEEQVERRLDDAVAASAPARRVRQAESSEKAAKQRVEELEAAVKELTDERDDALARVQELAKQVKEAEDMDHELVADLFRRLLHEVLPQTSQLRGRLLACLSELAAGVEDPPGGAKLANALGFAPKTLYRAMKKYNGARDRVLQSSERVTEVGAARSTVPEWVCDRVHDAWVRAAEPHMVVSEVDGKTTFETKYELWETNEVVWGMYVAHEVCAYLLEHEDEGRTGEEVYKMLMENQTLDGRQVVGRSTFMAMKPSFIVKGQSREAGCDQCRKFSRALKAVESFIEPDTHKGCEDPSTCSRTQECETVRNMEGQFDEEQKGLLRDLRALVPAWKEHSKLRAAQKKFVEKRLRKMRANEALVGMDFSPFEKTYARSRTLGEGMTGAQALMVELYYRTEDTRKDKFELEHFMFIAPAGNDKLFVRRALLEFGEVLRERGFTGVQFVSDGGPKHFKLKSSIFFRGRPALTIFRFRVRGVALLALQPREMVVRRHGGRGEAGNAHHCPVQERTRRWRADDRRVREQHQKHDRFLLQVRGQRRALQRGRVGDGRCEEVPRLPVPRRGAWAQRARRVPN